MKDREGAHHHTHQPERAQTQEQLTAIDLLLTRTLQKQDVLAYIGTEIQPTLRR